MALETPNRMHATFTAFYAVPDAIPPGLDNEAIFVLTAATGVQSIAFPPSPDFPGDFTGGLMVVLQEPVNSGEGINYVSGWEGAPEGGLEQLTPWPLNPETGNAVVDDFANTNGNYLFLFPDYNEAIGFMSVSFFELPQVDDAGLPAFPLTLAT